MLIEIIFAVMIAYLIGSLSSAIIVCKMMHLPDPRTQGSRNPGATNVLRIGGKRPAILTLFGDMLKGLLPVLIAKWYGLNDIGIAFVTFAAFLGHLFPVFFHFEGGKGVATTIGCLLALSWPVGLSWLITWFIVALIFRYSSLSSLIATLLAPLYMWYFTHHALYTLTIFLMCIILIYRHRSNITNLFAGKESKIGHKKIV